VNSQKQLVLIWWGIAFALIYGAAYYFLTGFFPPPPADLSPEAVVQLYAANNMAMRIGVVVCLVAGAFQLPWVIALYFQMARVEKGLPVWSVTQLLGGSIGALLFVLPPLFWGIAAFTVERDPQVTTLMHEIAFLTFITPVSLFIFQALPVAMVSFQAEQPDFSPLPRWMGFFSLWMVVIAECGVLAQLFKTGPFAWNGLFTFWLPLSVFSAWFGVLSYLMITNIKKQGD
jgi:hypothetical protein